MCLVVALACTGLVASRDPVLVLSEIDPRGTSEWIELYNPTDQREPLDGYRLVTETDLTADDTPDVRPPPLPDTGTACAARTVLETIALPVGRSVAPHSYFVLCLVDEDAPPPDPPEPVPVDPCAEPYCDGCAVGEVSAGGGLVRLLWGPDSCQSPTVEVDRVGVPPIPSGVSYGRAAANGDAPWCLLSCPSPGVANDLPPPPADCPLLDGGYPCVENSRRVVINEVSARGVSDCYFIPSCPDWVELYWIGPDPVDLTGYALRNGENETLLPPGLPVLDAGNRYLAIPLCQDLVECLDLFGVPLFVTFGISADGDGLSLVSPDGSDWDRVWVPPLADGEWYARYPDGGDFAFTTSPTPSGPNDVPPAGTAPCVELIERTPLRVFPGMEIEVLVRATDRDEDLVDIALLWRRAGGNDPEQSVLMRPGKRPVCGARRLETGIFAGTIPAQPFPVSLSVSIVATDTDGNVAESPQIEILVQDPAWVDLLDRTDLLRINEVAADVPFTVDAGDWVELYNPSPVPIFIDGLRLTDNVFSRGGAFSENTFVPPNGFLSIFCDRRTDRNRPSEPHMPFSLSACREQVLLVHAEDGVVIDALTFQGEKEGRTLSRIPDGSPLLVLATPTPGHSNVAGFQACADARTHSEASVVINELLVDNVGTKGDGGGEFGDWLELFNRGESDVLLDGWSLADRALLRAIEDGVPTSPWPFPPGTCIPAGGHLVVWCDNDAECENATTGGTCEDGPLGELHANFELNRLRDYVQLLDPDRTVVDCIAVRFQARDIAVGRLSDGGAFVGFLRPTPGGRNIPEPRMLGGAVAASCQRVEDDLSLRPNGCRELAFAFRRGDANLDQAVDLADAVFVLTYLYQAGAWPICMDAADSDDNGEVELTDAVFALMWLYAGGERPPFPGPDDCGHDPTGDDLSGCPPNKCL